MQNFRPHIIIIILAALSVSATSLHAEKTLRGKLRTKTSAGTGVKPDTTLCTSFDTIRVMSQTDLRLSGYDKPLNSRKESLFVSNRLTTDITAIGLRLIYTDMAGRSLHEVTREIRAEIPAEATRRIEFPSWDRQNSFYYHKGRKPRVDNVSPYDVKCTVTYYVTQTHPAKQEKTE